jgi:hypothetical protein
LILLISFSQIAQARLFDILNERYINDISELPYSPGTPNIIWQQGRGNLNAWIDITGFRNMSNINGINYTFGDPAQEAIVNYGTRSILDCNYGLCKVDSIDTNITISTDDNITVAHLHTTMRWVMLYRGQDQHFTEHADFYSSELSPETFNQNISSQINITEYNNTIEPKILINIDTKNSSSIRVSYGNKTITHKSKIYHVERTEKGVYFANESKIDTWDSNNKELTRFGNDIIFNINFSTYNSSDLNITISNIYQQKKLNMSEVNITRYTFVPGDVIFDPVLAVVVAFSSIFFVISLIMIRRVF